MEKYLFLYLNTGGGHYSPAKAIAETIKKNKDQILKSFFMTDLRVPGLI